MSKVRMWAGLCCLLPILAASCVSGPAAGGPEKLHGTWANREYFGSYWTHTFTVFPDGRDILFQKSDLDTPTEEGRYAIDRKWMDRDGSTWYQVTWRTSYFPYNEEVARSTRMYSLVKIDASGATCELEDSAMTWPKNFGELGSHHFVYYRMDGAEKIQGTWVDRDKVGTYFPFKYIYSDGGVALGYIGQEGNPPAMEGRYRVEKAWVDSKGATWLHVFTTWGYPPYNAAAAEPNHWYALISVSAAGDTMDVETNQIDFPPAFGAMGNTHSVFHRE
jgi:hypothetical protein